MITSPTTYGILHYENSRDNVLTYYNEFSLTLEEGDWVVISLQHCLLKGISHSLVSPCGSVLQNTVQWSVEEFWGPRKKWWDILKQLCISGRGGCHPTIRNNMTWSLIFLVGLGRTIYRKNLATYSWDAAPGHSPTKPEPTLTNNMKCNYWKISVR